MSALVGVALMVSGVLIGGFAMWLTMYLREIKREITSLKESQRTRLPYKVADGLEDAIAVALDLQAEIELLQTRNVQLAGILRTLRGNPSEYDSDKPNGKRTR